MTLPNLPYVTAYVWDRGRRSEHAGAMIRSGGLYVFIPADHLRGIADQLHDRADQLEDPRLADAQTTGSVP